MRATLILLAMAAASVGVSPLSAQAAPPLPPSGPSPDAVLRDLVAHASAALDGGAYKEATDYYRAAMKRRPSREIACNFGVAARLSGSLLEAAQAFTTCLAEPLSPRASAAEKKRRARYEADFEVVRQQLGALEIHASDGAEVFVDNTSVGRAPLRADVFVMPGRASSRRRSTARP